MWKKIEAAIVEIVDDWVAGTKAKREARELRLMNEMRLAQWLYEVEEQTETAFSKAEDRKNREAYDHHLCGRGYEHRGHAWDDGSLDFRVWCEGKLP